MTDQLTEMTMRAAAHESQCVEAALAKLWDGIGFEGLRRAKLVVETHHRSDMRFHLRAITMRGRRIWEGGYEEEGPLVFTWRERWLP